LPGQYHFFCDSETGRELAFEQIKAVLGAPCSGDAAPDGRPLVLFPGQGSHDDPDLVVGLEDAWEWKQAEDILGYDLLKICKETPAELKCTRIGQAATYVASYLRWKRWAEADQSRADQAIFAGFSLGEITTLAAASVLTFAQGLELIRVRGETMERACRSAPSTMFAVIGLPRDSVACLVESLNLRCGQDVSWICNELWDEGFVVGVRQEQAATLREQARAAGARQAIELKVEGAFHTPLMKEAQGAFADALAKIEGLRQNGQPTLRRTIYSNVTGAPYQSISEVFELLPQQISSPVRWRQVLAHASHGPDRIASVILPGPGKRLAGMLKNQSRALYRKHNLIRRTEVFTWKRS
jgi:[acyl-carrier-protein] S-malonyltransferase